MAVCGRAPGRQGDLAEDPEAFAQCRKAIDALLDGGTLAGTSEPPPIKRAQWRKLLRGVM